MIRKSSFFAIALSFAFASSADQAPVTYVDSNGVSQVCNSYTVVDENNMAWTTGWYVVDGTVDLSGVGEGVVVSGDVHLILTDGSSISVVGKESQAGLRVETGNSITIYGQTHGTGRLVATGGKWGAGIGSRESGESGTGCGTVIVNGGDVVATSGGSGAAGIGGGWNTDGGVVEINGGHVKAIGEGAGAGIGGGMVQGGGVDIRAGVVTINGGAVEAMGGTDSSGVGGGAGIGGSYGVAGAVVVINGGVVTAHGGNQAAGVGGGAGGAGGSFTIRGGKADIRGGLGGAGIGSGVDGFFCDVILEDQTGDANPGVGTVSIEGGILTAIGRLGGAGIGLGLINEYSYTEPYVYSVSASTGMVVSVGGSKTSASAMPVSESGVLSFEVQRDVISHFSCCEKTSYINEYGVLSSCGAYTEVASNVVEWTNGWYIVGESDLRLIGGVRVSGNVNLILSDGCRLSVSGETCKAGISIAQGGSLAIFGQFAGTGSLEATGGTDGGAGIGGDAGESGGEVVCYGGVVKSRGGSVGSAGIGAGLGGVSHGTLVVSSGKFVKAGSSDDNLQQLDPGQNGCVPIAGERLYVIGDSVCYADAYGHAQSIVAFTIVESDVRQWNSGWYVVEDNVDFAEGGVSISGQVHLILKDGASLTVQGDDYESGITVPEESSLVVYGQNGGTGALYATGGDGGAGIGFGPIPSENGENGGEGGALPSAGTVIVNGGIVVAKGGTGGAGIGGGLKCNGGALYVNGGSLVAQGGMQDDEYVAGVGCGYDGDDNGVLSVLPSVSVQCRWSEEDDLVELSRGPGGSISLDNAYNYFSFEGKLLPDGYYLAGTFGGQEFSELKYIDPSSMRFDGDSVYRLVWDFYAGDSMRIIEIVDGEVAREYDDSGADYVISQGDIGRRVVYFNPDGDNSWPCRYFFINQLEPVSYIDSLGVEKVCSRYGFVSEKTEYLTNGWYVVDGNFDLSTHEITIYGDVCLILKDEASLTVQGRESQAGIVVETGNSITIYGQVNGTGSLVATGGDYGAGIGSRDYDFGGTGCGTVTIVGGNVTAVGGCMAAGIGGGWSTDGGSVDVKRGKVVATGGFDEDNYAPGIGAGIDGEDHGELKVAENVIVKVGTDDDPANLTELVRGSDGSIELSGEMYYVIETSELVQPSDWPSVSELSASDLAGNVISDLPSALQGANAISLVSWANGAGGVAYEDRTGMILDAYLLNCTNTAEAVAAEKPYFRITKFQVGANGAVQIETTTTNSSGRAYNGSVTVEGSPAPIGPWATTNATHRFFRALLAL